MSERGTIAIQKVEARVGRADRGQVVSVAFHAEALDEDTWDWSSQAPTGFASIEDGEWDYNDEESYAGGAGYVSEYDMTEEDDDEAFLVMNFALLTESGFDQ